jgi:hypothetical protein
MNISFWTKWKFKETLQPLVRIDVAVVCLRKGIQALVDAGHRILLASLEVSDTGLEYNPGVQVRVHGLAAVI